MRGHHYLSSKLVGREIEGRGGHAVFAREPVKAGELLMVWGGDVRTAEEYPLLTEKQQMQAIQVEDDLYLVSFNEGHADWVNHSCDPNAWLVGQITLYARRDIQAGEEICFDYATSDSLPLTDFDCACGSPMCRGRFTGDDWKLPELQERYAGHFMPYLQRKIDALRGK